MKTFLQRHASVIQGTLSGFDRLVFRGTIRSICYPQGMRNHLSSVGVLLKDFGRHVETTTRLLKEASLALAGKMHRPVIYLNSSETSKEDEARRVMEKDKISDGLICVLSCVESCSTYEIFRNRQTKFLELKSRRSRCLFLYHYLIHPVFGFISARIQTWYPFSIQICLNGREWLGRQMDRSGLGYQRRDNCFTRLEDAVKAQKLMDRQLQAEWPRLLDGIARRLNPSSRQIFPHPVPAYYWSAFQSEWATDMIFQDADSLRRLYPALVRHGITHFQSPDVMRFLGRHLPATGRVHGHFQGQVVSSMKERPEGVRLRHFINGNSIKLYDKQGSILRTETTINDPNDFKVYRRTEGSASRKRSWQPLRKGIADLHRRAQVSQAANERYLEALSAVDVNSSLKDVTELLCRPVQHKGKRFRALNPLADADATLLTAIARGEFTINGFRNRDIRQILHPTALEAERKRRSSAISRKLRLLAAHGLIRKVTKTHRYLVTEKGRLAITALLAARDADISKLTQQAA